MSEKSFRIKLQLGFDNTESLMSLFNLLSFKLTQALEHRDITPEHKFTGIEIIDNKDYSYSVMFNFDNEHSIEEILDKAIAGGK